MGPAPSGGRRPAWCRPDGAATGPTTRLVQTGRMAPVLDPHPQNGQKKLLMVLGTMLAITVLVAVVATLVAP